MNLGDSNQRFGILWLFFGYTLALHVLDEAGHDFLSVYNPNAFGDPALALTSLAFRGLHWMRLLAIPVSILIGIGNGSMHILSSIYMKRLMPGVYSAPLILLSGTLLLMEGLRRNSDLSAR